MIRRIFIVAFVLLHVCSVVALSDVPGPHTEVRMLTERPTFYVDGEPFMKPLFATYVPTLYYYQQMADIGLEVFNFQTNCSACDIGFSIPTWKAEDEWDFSQMDERAHTILKAKSDAMILPRIYIGTPKWYYEKYPEQMIVLDHGGHTFKKPYNEIFANRPYACIVSPKWRKDMGNALRKTVEHMLQSDYGEHIFGFEIASQGSEEWYHLTVNQLQLGDYNPHMAKAFRDWLREKYTCKEGLQRAWGQDDVDFKSVSIPTTKARIGDPNLMFRDPATEMPVIDFYLFYNDVIADTIDYFAGIVKDVTQRTKVCGAFYNYMYEFRGNPEFGHNAGTKIMRSENIDFLCAPPSYFSRQLHGGAECYRRPFLPGTMHNKIWFHDNDLATFLFPKIHKNTPKDVLERHMEILAVTPTAQESIWLFRRAAGFVLAEGIYESYFDLHGGYFDDPRLLHALKQIAEMIDRSKGYDRSSAAEILVVADEVSNSYRTFTSDWPKVETPWKIGEELMAHQLGFIKCGAPFDSALLSDIENIDFGKYKVVMFLNTYNINDAAREVIEKKVKTDHRILIWCYAPGLFNGNERSVEAMQELVGMKVEPSQDISPIEPKQVLHPGLIEWLNKLGASVTDEPFGSDGKICRLFSVKDLDEDPLARAYAGLQGSDMKVVTMASKAYDDHISLYTLSSVMPPALIRAIAKEAQVHIFNDSDDTLYANHSYITINADTMGTKTIQLPQKSNVYNALTEDLYYSGVEEFEISMMAGETQIYRYEPAKE